MEKIKEKVSLITTLIDNQKIPGATMVTTIHELGNQDMKQGFRNLFDAGQLVGAAKLAGVGVVVYAIAKTGKWVAKKIKRDTKEQLVVEDPELQAAIQRAEQFDRDAMLAEEAKHGVDTTDCVEEIDLRKNS